MTLKMLAIGILVLLGLSSVMNPKTFRAFLGGLATLCMALFFGYVILGGKQQKQIPILSQLRQQVTGIGWHGSTVEVLEDEFRAFLG